MYGFLLHVQYRTLTTYLPSVGSVGTLGIETRHDPGSPSVSLPPLQQWHYQQTTEYLEQHTVARQVSSWHGLELWK